MIEATRGVIQRPKRVVIYGPEGIGKTTLAAQAPGAVFIDLEAGSHDMDVARFPNPRTWQELMAELSEIAASPGCCGTLVIDTADMAERMAEDYICTDPQGIRRSIESFGYGKGYTFLADEMNRLLKMLDAVMLSGANVALLAHAKMRKFEQPDEIGAYDRWELKLSKNVAPIVKEWADAVLFCSYETIVYATDKEGKNHKASGGKRVIYTSHSPVWDAKNRVGLPDKIDMAYANIAPCFMARE